jgi:hypothetical protein
VADILRQTQHVDHRLRDHKEVGVAVIAVLPASGCVVAVLAALRIMG